MFRLLFRDCCFSIDTRDGIITSDFTMLNPGYLTARISCTFFSFFSGACLDWRRLPKVFSSKEYPAPINAIELPVFFLYEILF